MKSPTLSWLGNQLLKGVVALISLALLWILLLVLVGLLTEVLIAPDASGGVLGYGLFTLWMIVSGAVVLVASWRWVTNIPNDRVHVRGSYDNSISPIVRHLRRRSGLCRLGAAGLFVLLASVTVVGFFVASGPARSRSEYHEGIPLLLPSLVEGLVETDQDRELIQNPEVVSLLSDILGHGAYPTWTEVVGALTLLLFLVQVIASLFRYTIQLSAFYDSRADYLQMGGQTTGLRPEELLNPDYA